MIIVPDTEELIDLPFKSAADLEAEEGLAQVEELKAQANKLLFDKMNVKFETAPYDVRFPHQNQTKHCWQNFIDHQKCIRAKGEDYKPCDYFKWVYKIMCPPLWVLIIISFYLLYL